MVGDQSARFLTPSVLARLGQESGRTAVRGTRSAAGNGGRMPAAGRRPLWSRWFLPVPAGYKPTGSRTVTEGNRMDFSPIDVQKHLKGVSYPASKEDHASTAEKNGAPGELVEQLRGLKDEEFSGPDDVMAALKRS